MADRRCLWQVDILKIEGLGFLLGLCGRPSLPLAGRNPEKLEVLDLLSLGVADRRCLWQVDILKIEGLGLLLSICGRPSLPQAGQNPEKLEVLDLLSL